MIFAKAPFGTECPEPQRCPEKGARHGAVYCQPHAHLPRHYLASITSTMASRLLRGALIGGAVATMCLLSRCAARPLATTASSPLHAVCETLAVYFGDGSYWHTQYDMYLLELEPPFSRKGTEATARVGYGGGNNQTGPYGLVCYHGGPAGTMYGDMGYAEAVEVLLDGGQAEAQLAALAEAYFAGGFVPRGEGHWFRQDPQDAGADYRNVIGIPGGVDGPLYSIIVAKNVNNMPLKPGANALVPDSDSIDEDVVYVYDTAEYPFYRGEQYHQFHRNVVLGREVPDTYLVAAKNAAVARGTINKTCSEFASAAVYTSNRDPAMPRNCTLQCTPEQTDAPYCASAGAGVCSTPESAAQCPRMCKLCWPLPACTQPDQPYCPTIPNACAIPSIATQCKQFCKTCEPSSGPPSPPSPPSPPGPPSPPSPGPGSLYNCAELGRGQDIVHDQATCESWDLCADHRGYATWAPAGSYGPGSLPQCSCTTKSASGGIQHNACEVTDAPLPNSHKCAPVDQGYCSDPFETAQYCVKKKVNAMMTTCDPSAPEGDAANEACRDVYQCVAEAFGADLKRCCNCIAFLAGMFDKDMAIDCSA